MDRSFKFAILQASPDPKRGELVNIGVVVATPEGLDIRLPELRKLRALTGHGWEAVAQAYARQLSDAWDENGSLEGISESFSGASQVFALSVPGTLRSSAEDYDSKLKTLMSFLVDRPILSRLEKQERINTEISKVLKKAGVLGQKGQTIDDNKVISKFVVSEKKDIVADFAYKGLQKLKIVSTLDLRGSNSAHAKACEKGATLYFAKQTFGDAETIPFGVYAVSPPEKDLHQGEIEILSSFADGNTFNWLDAHDRQRFAHTFY